MFSDSVRTFRFNNESKKILCYKRCTFVEGVISLKDNEIKKLVNRVEEKHVSVVTDESNDLYVKRLKL